MAAPLVARARAITRPMPRGVRSVRGLVVGGELTCAAAGDDGDHAIDTEDGVCGDVGRHVVGFCWAGIGMWGRFRGNGLTAAQRGTLSGFECLGNETVLPATSLAYSRMSNGA